MQTYEDLFNELNKDLEFRKEYRKRKPYYDFLRDMIARRKALGITYDELAIRTGVSKSYLIKIESAEHNARLSVLVAIAEALDSELLLTLKALN